MTVNSFDQRERAFEAVDAAERSVALTHLIRDAGVAIAHELTHQGRNTAISVTDNILAQRKVTGEAPLDFTKLGATEDQLARIAEHQERRRKFADADHYLLHDVGLALAEELKASIGADELSERVAKQREEGRGYYQLGLKELGFNDEQIARAQVHQEARQGLQAEYRVPVHTNTIRPNNREEQWFLTHERELMEAARARQTEASRDPRDVLSETAAMRAAGLDVDGEGYGRRGIAPRPAAQPLGRINNEGPSAGLAND